MVSVLHTEEVDVQ